MRIGKKKHEKKKRSSGELQVVVRPSVVASGVSVFCCPRVRLNKRIEENSEKSHVKTADDGSGSVSVLQLGPASRPTEEDEGRKRKSGVWEPSDEIAVQQL